MSLHPYDRLGSAPSSENTTPNRKGKKRVGWHSSDGSLGGNVDIRIHDFGDPTHSPMETTPPIYGKVPENAPDPQELSTALSRIASGSSRKTLVADESASAPAIHTGPSPSFPRPALRRNTSYDAFRDQLTADRARCWLQTARSNP